MELRSVEIVEVAARDGLQNESREIGTQDKLGLIERAIDAGIRRLEVTSFVNPRAVPQMADADDLSGLLPDRPDVTYVGLVLNERGARRALATGRIDQLGAVAVATDRFAMANQGQTSDGSIDVAHDIINLAQSEGKTGQVTIAAAFGCPFEGEVPEERVVRMAEVLADAKPIEIALADTIGVADPARVARLVSQVAKIDPDIPVRVHFHNTRGTGIANAWSAIQAGARIVDSSLGGLGGCPFAPGATGNISTEDLVYMLSRAGFETGVDLPKLIEANAWLTEIMERQLSSMAARAPLFPQAN